MFDDLFGEVYRHDAPVKKKATKFGSDGSVETWRVGDTLTETEYQENIAGYKEVNSLYKQPVLMKAKRIPSSQSHSQGSKVVDETLSSEKFVDCEVFNDDQNFILLEKLTPNKYRVVLSVSYKRIIEMR